MSSENKQLDEASKEELLGLADNYFISVFNVFRKTVKYKKREGLFFLLGFGFLLLSTGGVVFGLVKLLHIGPDSGSIVFITFAGGLAYMFGAIFGFFALDARKRKKLLQGGKLAFCHIYSSSRELRAYLTNERPEHIKNARFDFDRYLLNSEVNFSLEVQEMRPGGMGGPAEVTVQKPANIGTVLDDISTKFWWFSMSETAKTITAAYQQLPSKISARLVQEVEIDKVLPCLNDLVLYEYSKLRKTSVEELTHDKNFTIAEAGRACLFDFAAALEELEPLKEPAKQKQGYFRIAFKRATSGITEALLSPNILTSFITWYFLFELVFGLSVLITIKLTHITLDSTLLVGLFAVPFTAAVAVSTAVFTKAKR